MLKKKIIAASMALMLAMLTLAACQNAAGPATSLETQTPATETAATETPATETPATETPATQTPAAQESIPTLTIGVKQNANVEDYKTTYFTKLIEKDLGVNLEFMVLPADNNDARTKFALLVTSNSELPDVLNMGLEDVTTFDYAKKGVFVDISSYINDPAIAVNIGKMSESDKEFVIPNITMPDGKIYGLFYGSQNHWNEGPWRAWANNDWFTKMDIPIPKTTDELTTALRAMVSGDPNGNNNNDEMGIIGSSNGWAQDPIPFLMNAFTYANKDKRYLHVENDVVYASYTRPEWKDGLTYIASLVTEGLLSPLSFTQDSAQLKALATNPEALCAIVTSGSFSVFGANDSEAGLRMTLMPPITGPEGVSFVPQNPSQPYGTWYVTKDCKDVPLAVRVGDNFFSDEMSLIAQTGEKGVHWSDDPAITKDWVGRYQDTPGWVILENLSGKPNNVIWQDTPRFERWGFRIGAPYMEKSQLETTKVSNFNAMHLQTYAPYFPEQAIGRLMYLESEMDRVSTLETAIREYVEMSTVEFVTGNRPISEYDKFLDELDKMGMAEYIQITQSAYDRSK